VGSGPNGLSAGIALQQQGLSVLIIEAKSTFGGGLRSAELTLPGFTHDVCSAIHPMAVASPFFRSLPLSKHGLEFIYPPVNAAHPFDNGDAAVLVKSMDSMISQLGSDGSVYQNLMRTLAENSTTTFEDILGPLKFPRQPMRYTRFGWNAIRSARHISKKFGGEKARGLWAGMAAHSLLPLTNIATAAIGLVLLGVGHVWGWPIAKGGSQQIANALASHFQQLGGKIETGVYIRSLNQLPSARAILLDVTPRQLLEIAGLKFSSLYTSQLKRYRYGMGVFKIDFALADVVPFTNELCRQAGTVHLGNTYEEIELSEHLTNQGKHVQKPFVLLAQQSVFDRSRAPEDKHTVWAYCHVPNGSTKDMSQSIESQIERFAPGFRERILAKHTFNTSELEEYNPNYIGGDINAGAIDVTQLFTRPALRFSPYRTSARGIYICSASTPPGGGVHGMCGYHAANRALKDIFNLRATLQPQ
jgi:phytoene dehydrogenase-like protein